jgi:hypothetical protein
MAEFADIGKDGTVLRVIIVRDEDCEPSTRDETPEQAGIGHLERCGIAGRWVLVDPEVQRNRPDIGDEYDKESDVFVTRKAFEHWVLDEETMRYMDPGDKVTLDQERQR